MTDKILEQNFDPTDTSTYPQVTKPGWSGYGQGGQYDKFVSKDANAMKCPPGWTMKFKYDSTNKMVPHCINDETGEECPKSQMVNGKCKGKSKFKKVEKGGPGPIKTDDDAKTSGGGEGETGGPGIGPGEDPNAQEKKKDKAKGDKSIQGDDKDKGEEEQDKGKDSEQVATGLNAEELAPFRALNSLKVYLSGRGKGKDYKKLLDFIETEYEEGSEIKSKVLQHFKNSDWILFDVDDDEFISINTRYRPSTGDRRGVLTTVSGGKEVNRNLFEVRKLNGKYDKLGGGLKYMFEALSLIDFTIKYAKSGAAARWGALQTIKGLGVIQKELYIPALMEALKIVKDYDPEEDGNNVGKKAIYDNFQTSYPSYKDQQNMLAQLPDENKLVSSDKEPPQQQEIKTMNKNDIRTLIKEAFTDKVYGQYPYSHRSGDEEEPKEDYVEEWKRFCMEMVQDKSKERAIAIAKLLVKDVELFEDVLDLAGQNQSVGSEILRKMQKSEEV